MPHSVHGRTGCGVVLRCSRVKYGYRRSYCCNVRSRSKVCTSSLGRGFSAHIVASSSLVSALVTVHSFSLQSAQFPMVSATINVTSAIRPGQPSLSGMLEHLAVPPLLSHGDTASEALQSSLDLVRDQRKAATRLPASRFAD